MPRDWIFSYQREGFSGLLSGLQIQYAQVGLTDLPKVYKKIPLCKHWKQRHVLYIFIHSVQKDCQSQRNKRTVHRWEVSGAGNQSAPTSLVVLNSEIPAKVSAHSAT